MSTPNADPIFVRASVSNKCNLACVYCPKKEGMENRVPKGLSGRSLSVTEYGKNLEHLARNSLKGISFTGGEPTLNKDLPTLIKHACSLFERVELTSNGRYLPEILPLIAPYLDVLKVSLDTTDPVSGKRITNGTLREVDRATSSIREACRLGITVGVNVVVMKSNVSEIYKIIEMARKINQSGYCGKAYVSLLDFYFSAEKRAVWEEEFVSITEIAGEFESRFGPKREQERFGCDFFWFNADGIEVRFKNSIGTTHRAAKCNNCKLYCQEGIYGLKHSIEGWVTTCPTGHTEFGNHLSPGLSDEAADRILAPLLKDIREAVPVHDSFNSMLTAHLLTPLNLTNQPKGKP